MGGGATIVAMLTLVGVAGAQTVPQRASSQAADARPASEDTMPAAGTMQHGEEEDTSQPRVPTSV